MKNIWNTKIRLKYEVQDLTRINKIYANEISGYEQEKRQKNKL
jgi:hypothetical protein